MATYGIKMNINGNKTVVKTGLTKEEAKAMRDETNNKIIEMCGSLETMKAVTFIEMNAHEKQVDRFIQNAVSEYIGGWENAMNDSEEGSEEYESAKKMLNHDTLFELIYSDVMDYSQNNFASHIRFAGKAFIEDRIEDRLKKEGYGK